eukprot:CAMPEP_0181290480 /NCGR_PEP_ID=MMETSP1101-20121128/1436_1 /TAXON_ID=46948 /ORGANISM="Rhodomonas abbreviata, Strain Caron Lab Isolate" /LENGTH=158 /DNA_ID=CAMNT_0023394767 /DNA_START=204 /DNA_END=680 /DNA_ORIENTATION=+
MGASVSASRGSKREDASGPVSPAAEPAKLENTINVLKKENDAMKTEHAKVVSELQELRVEHERLDTALNKMRQSKQDLVDDLHKGTSSPEAGAQSTKPVVDRLRMWLGAMDLKDVLTQLTLEEVKDVDKSKALPALGNLDKALHAVKDVFIPSKTEHS